MTNIKAATTDKNLDFSTLDKTSSKLEVYGVSTQSATTEKTVEIAKLLKAEANYSVSGYCYNLMAKSSIVNSIHWV